MKKIILSLILFTTTIVVNAQSSKTVTIKSGGLYSALTLEEKRTVTDLTIIGTIDARDFVTIRDSLEALSSLDLSKTKITSYSGNKGTQCDKETKTYYDKNVIPINAFYNSSIHKVNLLSSIELPLGITCIDKYAFSYCENLQKINIPQTVKVIESSAFSECKSLKEFIFPNGIKEIPDFVLHNCKNLIRVEIPESVKGIYLCAFSGCENIKSINIPKYVNNIFITNHGFENITGLFLVDSENMKYSSIEGVLFNKSQTDLIQWPSSISIKCEIPSTTSIIYPNNILNKVGSFNVDPNNKVYSSKDGVLLNKTQTSLLKCPESKQGNYSIPSSVTHINLNAFINCSGISKLFIPSSVKSIESGFQYFNGLIEVENTNENFSSKDGDLYNKSYSTIIYCCTASKKGIFEIPNTVKKIGFGAIIYSGNELETFIIPDSVKEIELSAFAGSSFDVIVGQKNQNYSSIDGILFDKNRETLLYCPTSKTGNYEIPSSVSIIERHAFYQCNKLNSITIPNSVNFINPVAFLGCDSLSSIYSYSKEPAGMYSNIPVFDRKIKISCTLHIPKGSIENYRNVEEWNFTNIVDDL